MKSISDLPLKKTAIRVILAIYICIFVFSCSRELETKFDSRVLSVQNYFSKKPVLLGDIKITKNKEDVYAYYGLKVINFKLSFDIQSNFLSAPTAYIKLSCEVLSNQDKGDLVDDRLKMLGVESNSYVGASGFSSIIAAINHKDFSKKAKDVIFYIKYIYKGEAWSFSGLETNYFNRSIDTYLKQSQHCKDFREAIGMIE